MIGNYFKVAARNMQKRKVYSFINAFGLSIGIAFCILIFLYIEDERGFDQFHANKDHIYRIEEKSFDTWEHDSANPYRFSAWIQTALQPVLKEECPEVLFATRYNPDSRAIFRYGEKVFTEELTYVDADFFKMFSIPWVKGSPEKIFMNPSDVVITRAIATKYFGDENPLGKTIELHEEESRQFTVVGVVDPLPANSSLHYSVLVPQENRPYYKRNVENWGNFNTPTMVQLQPNADVATFKKNLDRVIEKYMGDKLKKWRAQATVHIPEDARLLEFIPTPMPAWHLKKEIGWEKVSDPQYSWILGGIALLIILIASINYVSLSLTTSASRKTEVGIRKVVGAQRSQLVYQFGFESIILALLSLIVGLGLVFLFLPSFNQFTGKAIELNYSNLPMVIGASVLLALVVGLLAGSYPSLFLSRFRPSQVLKGGFTTRLKAGFTRPLVVLQFAMSAFLIISSVIMYRQMQYVTTKDLGYEGDQVLVIPTQTGWNKDANQTIEQFRARAMQESGIVAVTGTSSSFNQGYSRYGYKVKEEQKSAYVYAVDPHYLPSLGIELVAGRNFDPGRASDSAGIIVNEALVRDMKWTEPLNEHLNWREDSVGLGSPIIGVVKDYHFLSLERNIEPMFLSMDKENIGYLTTMLVKVSANDVAGGLEKVKAIWKELYPDRPFDYTFMDEDVAKQYESFQRWMSIMSLSTGFAILISCLGLFGLAGINAVNRTKEIGIRKVMGANVTHIFLLLNRQFIWLSVVAFALAIPFSCYVMNKWLADFQFRIDMTWELFAASMLAGLAVALVTVTYHSIKASAQNPAETLKYE